ncbi:hypothetical protein ASG31_07940 [Chryseobacterium sp. Leaf404]|uniref:hypothetical protein n=1 Tax=unclassified Chryseobacterium TaxID=2593645 RepID=UPI0006FA0653|nr:MULTISPECIES: hypothetical protein [unclassified Chryseobacterium]KQT17686.1 hypothetical protein ASG31_07940 [Chryseobacterium sp. Leaf404]
MKKLVVVLAIASVAVSCKKISAGGNKSTLKLEEGVERYSDDHQGGGDAHGHAAAPAHAEPAHEAHKTEAPKTDSAAAEKPVEAAAPAAAH